MSGVGLALIVTAGLVSLSCLVNVATALDEAHRHYLAMPLWRPLTLEASSNAVVLLISPSIYAIIRLTQRSPLWRRLAILAAGSVPFSLAHVALMILTRVIVFAALGHAYAWGLWVIPYEYRKDLMTYVLLAGIFWLLPRSQAVETPQPQERDGPHAFDIRDGASLVRAPVADILAARAAGNYVEFLLADGRRPLMRASLARVEAQLSAAGFVRTHRSWLVNPRRVRSLVHAGSGDFRIDLGTGVNAPLARRYPAALSKLRGDG